MKYIIVSGRENLSSHQEAVVRVVERFQRDQGAIRFGEWQ